MINFKLKNKVKFFRFNFIYFHFFLKKNICSHKKYFIQINIWVCGQGMSIEPKLGFFLRGYSRFVICRPDSHKRVYGGVSGGNIVGGRT